MNGSHMINMLRVIIFFLFSSIALSDQCNDSFAINYTANDDCVYYNITSINVNEEEDLAISIDLSSYIDCQGVPCQNNVINDFSFEVDCGNVFGVSECSMDGNDLTAKIENRSSDYATGNLKLNPH